ncbi:glutaredoxin domain-containing protein [Planomonospora corallina]|uniref:Glutaredoxin domain-containing protein n=1 Tax=Planomonospora corallina TaxID=1806052 RepID=A0ABV8IHY2_9ACTN
MRRALIVPVLFALIGLLAAARQLAGGSPAAAAALLLVFGLLAGLSSPLAFPASITAAEASRRSAADGRPIVYWRPGCPYCLKLRMRLGRHARQLHWVDIWRDPEGAERVRAATGGDETVPTVVMAGLPYVNPDPGWVRERL